MSLHMCVRICVDSAYVHLCTSFVLEKERKKIFYHDEVGDVNQDEREERWPRVETYIFS